MTDLSSSIFPKAPAALLEGIGCFHPEIARGCQDYPEEGFDKLLAVEDGNFWFESRNRALEGLIRRHLAAREEDAKTFLEIGCGTGFVLRMLAGLPGVAAAGSEIHLAGAKTARVRNPGVEVVQLDALKMDFDAAFDAVGAFDVVEHLDDDGLLMRRVRQALKPGGLFFVTVPQYAFLWSAQDDLAGHKRRYTRRMLRGRLEEAGFTVSYLGSLFFSVFPLYVLSRLRTQRMDADEARRREMREFALPPAVNRLLALAMELDLGWLRAGGVLPCGSSLVAVARRD